MIAADVQTGVPVLIDAFRALGFIEGPPPGLAAETMRVDAEVVAEAVCPDCREPLEYRPFHRGRRYVAAAVCRCGYAEEM